MALSSVMKPLQESDILDCNCMTYNESTGTVAWACFYNCVNAKDSKDVVYHRMTKTVEQLTKRRTISDSYSRSVAMTATDIWEQLSENTDSLAVGSINIYMSN